ncbi:MAG: hypothetical protein AAB511_00290 [Patescibacteria group bacterium]
MEPQNKEKKACLEKVNSFLSKWAPVITVIGICLALIPYINEKISNQQNFKAVYCINYKLATFFVSASAKEANWQARYHVNEYLSDWNNSINYFDTEEKRIGAIATIENMITLNRMQDQFQFYEPFIGISQGQEALERQSNKIYSAVASSSKTILSNLSILGFNKESCNDLVAEQF